jgi:PIN domain nuclease of toxin-antitoxin system
MKLLLDTHIFLWLISGDKRLSSAARAGIRDPKNDVYLSAASIWEAVVKYQLGKLPLPQSPETYLPAQRQQHSIKSLAIDEDAITHLPVLPALHRDPFDRILICQALQHGMTLVTVDTAITAYPVPTMS